MKLGKTLEDLADVETSLADEFRRIGERHAADHDVYHVCHTLADQCDRHAAELAPHIERYGSDAPADRDGGAWQDLLETVRRTTSDLVARRPESGLLLLRDLRVLFLAAEDCSIRWVMAGQAAQAARDRELLDFVRECHTETEIQVKWLTTRIKLAAPQTLVSE